MKILHLIPNLKKGGAQRIALDLCNSLSKLHNAEVKLVYFEGENEFSFLTQGIDVTKINLTHSLSLKGKNSINIDEYENLLDHFEPDIIHSHLYLAELVSRENPRKSIVYISHCHDNIRQFHKWNLEMLFVKQRMVEFIERRRLFKRYRKCNNFFIAISEDGKSYLEQHLPKVFRKNLRLIHNGFDFNSFYNLPKKKPAVPARLINVGNFIPKKNQEFLVNVKNLLDKRNLRTELILVGDGETINSVKETTKKFNLNSVHFTGNIDDIRKILTDADIYVHSALYEPFGLVILEAMAAGLPVISLDGRGNRDIISNNINGFLVSQGDLGSFAENIIKLLETPNLYEKIALNGQDAAKKYNIESYSLKILNLYKDVIRRS
jgi:glycosyltransferase involved in cell wall biosynthesis